MCFMILLKIFLQKIPNLNFIYKLQKYQLIHNIYMKIQILYQEQSLMVDFIRELYQHFHPPENGISLKDQNCMSHQEIIKMIQNKGKVIFDANLFLFEIIFGEPIFQNQRPMISLILLELGQRIDEQFLIKLQYRNVDQQYTFLLVDKPSSKIKSGYIEKYLINVTEQIFSSCQILIKKENCLEICINQHQGIKEDYFQKLKSFFSKLESPVGNPEERVIEDKIVKFLEKYDVLNKQQCLKQLLQGNSDEASAYIKRNQRQMFRQEISNLLQYQNYKQKITYQDQGQDQGQGQGQGQKEQSFKDKAIKYIQKVAETFSVKQNFKKKFIQLILEKQLMQAQLKIEKDRREFFKRQISFSSELKKYWNSLPLPHLQIENKFSNLPQDKKISEEKKSRALSEIKQVIQSFDILEKEEVQNCLMKGDIEGALSEIPSKQKQKFTKAIKDCKNLQIYLEEIKKQGERDQEEKKKLEIFNILKKYRIKNLQESFAQLLNRQLQDVALKVPRTDRPRFKQQIEDSQLFKKHLISSSNAQNYSQKESLVKKLRELAKKYSISNETEFIGYLMANNLDDAILMIKKTEREDLKNSINSVEELRNYWGRQQKNTQDQTAKQKTKISQKLRVLLNQLEVVQVQYCIQLILEGKQRQAQQEIPRARKVQFNEAVSKCQDLKKYLPINKPKDSQIRCLTEAALRKICLQHQAKDIEECIHQILSINIEDALIHVAKQSRRSFQKKISECRIFQDYKESVKNLEIKQFQNNAKKSIEKIMKKYSVKMTQDCMVQILEENYEEAKLNVKKDLRQAFIDDILKSKQYQVYLQNKQKQKQDINIRASPQLIKILKNYIVDYQNCIPLIQNGQIQQVLKQVKSSKRQNFKNELNKCENYCLILKHHQNNMNPLGAVVKILKKNNIQKQRLDECAESIVKGHYKKLKSQTNLEQCRLIFKEIFQNPKIVLFLEQNQNFYEEISYFYHRNFSLEELEETFNLMQKNSELKAESIWIERYYKKSFNQQIQMIQKEVLNVKEFSKQESPRSRAVIQMLQSLNFSKSVKQLKKIEQKLIQMSDLVDSDPKNKVLQLTKLISQSKSNIQKINYKDLLCRYELLINLLEKKEMILRKMNIQDINQLCFLMNSQLLNMQMHWESLNTKISRLIQQNKQFILRKQQQSYYKNKQFQYKLKQYQVLYSNFSLQIDSLIISVSLFGKNNLKIACKDNTNLHDIYKQIQKISKRYKQDIILEFVYPSHSIIMKIQEKIVPKPISINCYLKMDVNVELKGIFFQVSIYESISSPSLLNFLIDESKLRGFKLSKTEPQIFAVFQGSSNAVLVNEPLNIIIMKEHSQLKYLKIKAKHSVIVYYEEDIYKFVKEPDDQVLQIKQQILNKIKVPINSQSLLFLKGEQQYEVFNQKLNQLQKHEDIISFRLISKMNLEHYGFHENYSLTYEEFSKFFISKEKDIIQMVKTSDLKKEQEKNFFDQLIRHLYASIKRKFKFSHITNDVKYKIMEKYSQEIWSGGDFNNYFILYYILFNADSRLKIQFMNITNSMFPLPLFLRTFNNINDVKNEWKINKDIVWILHDSLCITSIGLHTKNIQNQTGKTYLNNKLFYTEFQRKKQKHPICFGCPQISLNVFGTVFPINFIDIPSNCQKQIAESIIRVSNFLIVHSWLDLSQTQKTLRYYSESLGIKNFICFMRDSKNRQETNKKVTNANFEKNPVLSLHNFQQYVIDQDKGVALYKILKQKVWQAIKKANDTLQNKSLIYNLFQNGLFTKMQSFSEQMNKQYLELKVVCTKCQELKRVKSKKYQNDSSQIIQEIKKQIISKGLHPTFKKLIQFIRQNPNYQYVLILRFKEILKSLKNTYQKKYLILNKYNQKIKLSNWRKEDHQFKLFKEEVIKNVQALPLMTKFQLKETPFDIIQGLAKKIQYFEDEIKSKFFTIEIAWRQLQYLTAFDPEVTIGNIYLIDFLIQLKREDINNNQPFQILDGDILETPKNITKKVFEGMNSKVAIITVFGPQSSGKSTLLNFLFGCDFGTSEGRCTKGGYGTYFRFSNIRISSCQGVFLVDTQGLFATVNKKDAEFRKDFDSKLVLFCLAISDFVIINTKGNLDVGSQKIVKSSWQRFGALAEENIEWPELNLVLNQNASANIITSESDINKLRQLFNVNKSYSLNQAYHLAQISNKDVCIVPQIESYVRKSPREEFLSQTNVLQNSLIEQIQNKTDFKSIQNAIDLMQRVWSTIEAYPDLGKSVSKNIQEIQNKIKEWRIKNIEDLVAKREQLINLLKAQKKREKDCQLQFEDQIKKCKDDYKEKYLSDKQLQKLNEEEKLKIELEQNKCLLAFQAIKFELSAEIKDFQRDKLADKCKIQGSQYEIQAIRKVKELQRNEKRELTNQQKEVYFEEAFQKSLKRIQSISSPEEKLDNYFDRIFQFYSSAIQNTSTNKKNDKSAGLPRPEWKCQTGLNYSDFSSQIISFIFKLIGVDSNKYIESKNTPPTKVLDQSQKTDAKLGYFNMRKYFNKQKIECYFQIPKNTLQKSLKEKLLLNQMSQIKQSRIKPDYIVEQIYKSLNQYISLYFGISFESFDNFKEFFEYKTSFFNFRTKNLKIILSSKGVKGVQKKVQKSWNDKDNVNIKNYKQITTRSYTPCQASFSTQNYGKNSWNYPNQSTNSKTLNSYSMTEDTKNIEGQQEQFKEFYTQAKIKEIENYFNIEQFKIKFKQIKNLASFDKQYLVENLKKSINWKQIQAKMKKTQRYCQLIQSINNQFMMKINNDLSYFGVKCYCDDLYQYLMKNQKIKLIFVQTEMPPLSKSLADFHKKLSSLEKFDLIEGVLKNYTTTQSPYYLKIGRIQQEILKVKNNYSETKQLAAYIGTDKEKIYYSLKSQKMKNFVFAELNNKNNNSFFKLFRNIDNIVQKSTLILSRNTIINIYIDVAREVAQFNNDLNQVSQKLTLIFIGYVHLYALYMSWKKFSEMALKQANKPYNDLLSQREDKLNFFILETSNSDVTQSNGQSDRFLSQIFTYFKGLIQSEKKKINQNQAKKYKAAYPRQIIQQKIDSETFSVGSNVDDWFKYLTNPYQVIKKKYIDLADHWFKNNVKEYESSNKIFLILEQLKIGLKSILQKIKILKIQQGTIHTDIFSITKQSEKQISITDSIVREKLNKLVMSYFLDLLVGEQKKQYSQIDFDICINQKYQGLKIIKQPTPFLQSLISKLKSSKLSITRLYTFITMLIEKLDEKQTVDNIIVNKYENNMRNLLKSSIEDQKSFQSLASVYICKQLCPGCQRICGVDQFHTNKHQCKYGHQMRALGGVKLSNGDASVIRCEDVQVFNLIKFNGQEMQWKKFKQYWENKTQGSWNFDDLKIKTNKQHFIKAWDAVGKQACLKLEMNWVKSNQLQAQQMTINSTQSIHYIFALDDSGSMSGQKWNDLMKAYQTSISEIQKASKVLTNVRISVLIEGSSCIKYQENVQPMAVIKKISPRFGGNNFADTFNKAEALARTYVSKSKIRFIFMTDGGDCYPSSQISALKSLKLSNPNKIQYSGIQFQTSGDTMKLISKQLGGTNVISYTSSQLTSAYLEIINRDIK